MTVIVQTIGDSPLSESDIKGCVRMFEAFARRDPILKAMGYVDFNPVEKTLRKWVVVRYEGTFPNGQAVGGKRSQERRYKNVLELARAVMGEVAAKEGRRHEKQLARLAYTNQWISNQLDSALSKLLEGIRKLPNWLAIEKERAALGTGESAQGTYEQHFKLKDRLEVLKQPAGYDIKRKIIAFHDMSEFLQPKTSHVKPTSGTGTMPHPRAAAYQHSEVVIDSEGWYTGPVTSVEDRSRGKIDLGTRDVNNPGTASCMVAGVPVWAGTSMTTARMLETACWAGCSVDEREAIAWAIFAFWQRDYDQRISPVHTLHEVLDVARNYGVPYLPFFIPAVPPHTAGSSTTGAPRTDPVPGSQILHSKL